MHRTKVVGRRRFVSGGVCTAIAAISPFPFEAEARAPGENGTRDLAAGVAAMRDIAIAYLREHRDWAAILRLRRAFLRVPPAARSEWLAQWLHRGRSADFASGRVVTLSGWVLARSEIRLCVLLALSGGPR